MLHGRTQLPRTLRKGGAAPLAAAGAFATGCALVVLLLVSRPESWRSTGLSMLLAGASDLLHGGKVYAVHGHHTGLPVTYPPFAALSFVPMNLVGLTAARVVLTALSAVALVVCLVLSVHAVRPRWTSPVRWTAALLVATVALFTDPVYWTLSHGQVSLVLAALVLVDLLGRRTVLPRGALVGLATAVQLSTGIFVLYLALTRRLRAALTALAVLAASVAVGFAVAPGPSLRYWNGLVLRTGRLGMPEFIGNQSLHGVAVRLAGTVAAIPVGWAVASVLTLVAGLWLAVRAGRGRNELLGASLCAVTGLLVSPVSWNHYWVWALPVAVVLWARCLDLRAPGRLAVAAGWTAVFCLAPIWWVPYRHGLEFTLHGTQLLAGNAYVLAGLVLLAGAPLLVGPRPADRATGRPAVAQADGTTLTDAVR